MRAEIHERVAAVHWRASQPQDTWDLLRCSPMMSLEQYAHQVTDFVRDHESWALPVVAALAFGESLAVISLLLPATVALVGIGALIGASNLHFVPIWIAAALGAALGDWVSYWFGYKFKDSVASIWPLSHHPDLVPKGEAFVEKWGVAAVFIGRFFGPARAAVPLAAGILMMPFWPFQLANFTSAFVWAGVLLLPGTVAMKWVM
jgi:membrane protein DedA with SNARE-associated domain